MPEVVARPGEGWLDPLRADLLAAHGERIESLHLHQLREPAFADE